MSSMVGGQTKTRSTRNARQSTDGTTQNPRNLSPHYNSQGNPQRASNNRNSTQGNHYESNVRNSTQGTTATGGILRGSGIGRFYGVQSSNKRYTSPDNQYLLQTSKANRLNQLEAEQHTVTRKLSVAANAQGGKSNLHTVYQTGTVESFSNIIYSFIKEIVFFIPTLKSDFTSHSSLISQKMQNRRLPTRSKPCHPRRSERNHAS